MKTNQEERKGKKEEKEIEEKGEEERRGHVYVDLCMKLFRKYNGGSLRYFVILSFFFSTLIRKNQGTKEMKKIQKQGVVFLMYFMFCWQESRKDEFCVSLQFQLFFLRL